MKKLSAINIRMALVFCITMSLTGCNNKNQEDQTIEQKLMEAYVVQEYGPGNYYVEVTGSYSDDVKCYTVYADGTWFARYDHYSKEDIMLMLE